jgi:hypothetical protein
VNNLFFDVGRGGDSYLGLNVPGDPTVATNVHHMRSGTPGTYGSTAPFIDVDPLFVNAGDATGAGADYHLQLASPIKDSGTTLASVPVDYDGVARPLGAGYSIGAFER